MATGLPVLRESIDYYTELRFHWSRMAETASIPVIRTYSRDDANTLYRHKRIRPVAPRIAARSQQYDYDSIQLLGDARRPYDATKIAEVIVNGLGRAGAAAEPTKREEQALERLGGAD